MDLQRWLKGDPVSAPLRVVGELVKVCPECRRWNRGAQRQRCMYCDTDLARVEPEDTRFLGEQDPAPIDDDDEDDRPRRRRPRGR